MQRSIVSNRCPIVYDVERIGEGPAIVLLHGYGVDRRMWRPQWDLLCEHHTVINLDVRGHGQSRPCEAFSIKLAADDLKKVLEVERCTNAILIGLSMGGYIVQEYAFAYGGASGYMITGSAPIFLPCYSVWEKFMLRHSAGMMKLYSWDKMKEEMTKLCASTKGARDAIRPLFDTMTQKEFMKAWNGVARCLHEEKMQFDAPLLVTCGELDKTGTVKKCMQYWKPSYENCRTMIFKGAAHVANLDDVDKYNRVMIEFVDHCTE